MSKSNRFSEYRIDRSAVVVAVLIAMTMGCNNSKFEFAEVTGRILLNGEPVPEAKVVFMPTTTSEDGESGPYSQGVTDAEGRYELNTMDDDSRSGAVVGSHRVIVSTKQAHMDPDVMDLEIIDSPESIPWKYTHYKKTPLKFEVPSIGAEDADFALEYSSR